VDGYDTSTYGERIAGRYDDYVRGKFDEEAEAVLLAELAGEGGRALELGIGTGRVALALAARGVDVHGIESSPAMVSALRAKPGGEAIGVTLGDLADPGLEVPGTFTLAFAVFSTLFMLTTQEEQAGCMASVAARLEPGGTFVVEGFVPRFPAASERWWPSLEHMDAERVMLSVTRHDPVAQRLDIQRVALADGEVRLFPSSVRYAYPAELDLMARLAGLRLRTRWSGWRREPFTADSVWNVSVYERPAQAPG
jgi:SAM-dependent methyltransferase